MTYKLKNLILLGVLACLFVGINNSALADDLVELPRQLEIDLALSALPEALRDEATIYVRGFRKRICTLSTGP